MSTEVLKIEAAITLAREVLHRPHTSVDIAKTLHRNLWKQYYKAQPLEDEVILLASPDQNQLFIDYLNRFFSSTALGGQEYRDRRYLTEIEVSVTRARYGLKDGNVRNFTETAEVTGVTRETAYNANFRACTLLKLIPEPRWVLSKYFFLDRALLQ